MTNPADSSVQNLLPVQAYFNADGSFNTFIGQGQPFYATANPSQSGLNITNSTINSTTIGATTPSTGVFTNVGMTTGTISTQAASANDIVNLLALQSYAAGISWKQPCACATLAPITLLGLQTIDGYTTLPGDRVLVKDQATASQNGIYIASATAWIRALDANTWNELISAISFIEYGTQAGGAWFCTAQPGGTIDVTPVTWSQFTTSATYTAGTGLTLTGFQFSITPVGTASTYGSASTVPVFTTNASGQVSSVTNTNIAIGAIQITSGTIDSARLSGSYTGITGLGTLTDLTVTNAIVGSITGNAATATTAGSATTATTATNIAGGASGSIPYQTGSGATSLLAKGTDGQILALASGLPSWINNTVGTVTSVAGTGTVSGISLSGTVTSSGSLTLGGTLDLSAPPAIGGTTPNSITGTIITANTQFVSENYYAQSILGGNLRTYTGTSLLNWDGGGSGNITFNGGISASPANKNIVLSPSGTGTVTISPAGALTVNPTTASTINNVAIGGTTPLDGTFTTLRINSTLSLAGSTGTSGYVLTSNGASAPTWQTLPASGLTITDDTTTNATRYLAFTSATSGTVTGQNVASTKLQFNPSSGLLTATGFSGSGASLTSIPNSALTNSSVTVTAGTGMSGGGSVALGSSVTLTNAGVTSVTAGTGISVSASTGGVTITNTSSVNATQLCKAWINFGYISGSMTTRASYNVSSVTRNGSGNYTINFTSSFADANYAAVGLSSRNYNGSSNMSITSLTPGNNAQTQTSSGFTVTCQDQAGNQNDVATGSFAVFAS